MFRSQAQREGGNVMAYDYHKKGHHRRKWDDLKLILPTLIVGGGIVAWLIHLCLAK